MGKLNFTDISPEVARRIVVFLNCAKNAGDIAGFEPAARNSSAFYREVQEGSLPQCRGYSNRFERGVQIESLDQADYSFK